MNKFLKVLLGIALMLCAGASIFQVMSCWDAFKELRDND